MAEAILQIPEKVYIENQTRKIAQTESLSLRERWHHDSPLWAGMVTERALSVRCALSVSLRSRPHGGLLATHSPKGGGFFVLALLFVLPIVFSVMTFVSRLKDGGSHPF